MKRSYIAYWIAEAILKSTETHCGKVKMLQIGVLVNR